MRIYNFVVGCFEKCVGLIGYFQNLQARLEREWVRSIHTQIIPPSLPAQTSNEFQWEARVLSPTSRGG